MNAPLVYMLLLSVAAVGFSTWLMFHTFSYEPETGHMLIASRAWSDFAAHIPMIRSFSVGTNWFLGGDLTKLPQYPIFPGEMMRYHFLFYFLVGMLERAGLRIDLALNSLSILGMSLLITSIGFYSYIIFKSITISALSVLFFFFNGSLGFVKFFAEHPPGLMSVVDIITANKFPAFAPWGPGDVSAFWNFNIYTNQRHLGFGVGVGLLILIATIISDKLPEKTRVMAAVLCGLIIGTFPFLHRPMFLVLGVSYVLYFLLIPSLRRFTLLAGSIGLLLFGLQYTYLSGSAEHVIFRPGYLLYGELRDLPWYTQLGRFLQYWWNNLGLHMILIPLGYLLTTKEQKKLFLPLVPLFVIPNLFQFSVEMAASHKFFNVFLILGNILSAYALVYAWKFIQSMRYRLLRFFIYLFILFLIIPLTLTGIIDMAVVANDFRIGVADIEVNETAKWIRDNTDTEGVILTASYLYHPASLAGRKIFLGWPYFAWSAGYDTATRMKEVATFYETDDLVVFCALANQHNIKYATYEDPAAIEQAKPHEDFIRANFPLRFENKTKTLRLYDVSSVCQSV